LQATDKFGKDKLSSLLWGQAVPASVGILVMSIYGIVDTIFIGRWVGGLGIGAITVVMPITFLMASVGMSIGIGGASLIARFLGAQDRTNTNSTFGNQILATLTIAISFAILGAVYKEEFLLLFGANGDIYPYAEEYYDIVLWGIPFLAWSMMSNNVIRTIGYPRLAMFTLLIPAVVNIVLDPILIAYLDMGMEGAAWATTISYIMGASYTLWFFGFKQKELQITISHLIPQWRLMKQIFSLGAVTFSRQGVVSLLSIVLNNSLFALGGEQAMSVYGILSRILMFANFPVLGITQGYVPILGYNYGAKLWERVESLTKLAIRHSTMTALSIFTLLMVFTSQVVSLFTTDEILIADSTSALRIMFLATPLISINLIGSAYLQSVGKALPALLLALSKQGILLIPLILILPKFCGLDGIWLSFPLADTGAALITWTYFKIKEKNVSLL